jgi:hypothetical protein
MIVTAGLAEEFALGEGGRGGEDVNDESRTLLHCTPKRRDGPRASIFHVSGKPALFRQYFRLDIRSFILCMCMCMSM